ncbi:MAG: AI-2E family transporter [Campylobacteraceae bacterium]|nr:AI-2E family transporter [Campylobacteraceae bacterium]
MKTSKYFFIGFILFVFVWVIYLFNSFLLTMAIGILLAVSTANLNIKMLEVTNGRHILSATFTTLILLCLFLAPLFYAVIELAKYATNFNMSNVQLVVKYIQNFDFNLPERFEFLEPRIKNFILSFDYNALIKQVAGYASNVGKSGAKFVIDLALIIVFYFFANMYGKSLMQFIRDTLPIEASKINSITSEVRNTMSVVLYSTLATAVLQGVLYGSMISFFGYDGFLMGILYAFASMIPIVGGLIVYIPMCIYELATGDVKAAIFIFLYTAIVIGTIADNFVKPFIIKFINSKLVSSPANINELIIFFAMIAGLSTFGFWGIILGPAIVTLFIALLNAYRTLIQEFGG